MSRPLIHRSPDVVVRADAEVGESPVVDTRTGRLCWTDITRGEVRQDDLVSGSRSVSTLGTWVGAVAPRAKHRGFVVAVFDGFGTYLDEELEIVDPVLPEPNLRMNDAKCDSHGRWWAGSTHLDFDAGRGRLHRWEMGSPSAVASTGLTLPNGLGWNPRDDKMYLIDSLQHRLMVADFDAVAGEVGHFHTLREIPDALPDGLAVDVDSCLWVALWGGGAIRRYSPAGALLATIELPVTQPTSCAFRDTTLLITTASRGLDAAQRDRQPLAGSVFGVDVGVCGVPIAGFAG